MQFKNSQKQRNFDTFIVTRTLKKVHKMRIYIYFNCYKVNHRVNKEPAPQKPLCIPV